MRLTTGTAALLLLTACGAAGAAPASRPAREQVAVAAVRVPVREPVPRPGTAARPALPQPVRAAPVARVSEPFATPEAAMRHLALAYNSGSVAALRQVTTPHARAGLLEMAGWAPDLRLVSCRRSGGGHLCEFTHAYADATPGRGQAFLRVLPSARWGWYATETEGCG